MATAMFSVRMDSDLKERFEELCNDFGMNMTTAVNVFARAVVREERIPFEIGASRSDANARARFGNAVRLLRESAAARGLDTMTEEEIQAEIDAVR